MFRDTDPCRPESGTLLLINNLRRNPQQAASAGVGVAPIIGFNLNHEGEDQRAESEPSVNYLQFVQ